MPGYIDPLVVEGVRLRLGCHLDELLEVMLDIGTAPIFLDSEDHARLDVARSRAIGLVDDWAKEDPATVADLAARLPLELQDLTSQSIALLQGAVWDRYFEVPDELFGLPRPDSRVFTAIPTLIERVDGKGLIDLTDLDATPHGLRVGGYALHYHQFLRRGFHSNVHYELVSSILRLSQAHALRARIAVDERRLRRTDEYRETLEKDYWFGRLLNEDDLDSLTAVGETFHGDPAGGTSFLHPYAGLSVRWTSDGPLKVVQVEEFMPPPSGSERWVLARYLHAIRDTSKRAFVHCDGAVKAYDASRYPRSQSEFSSRGRGDRYRKVFRVDGEFPSAAWSTLLSGWFRGNSLVLEYLNL